MSNYRCRFDKVILEIGVKNKFIARQLNKSEQTITSWRKGVIPSKKNRAAMCDLFDMNEYDLFFKPLTVEDNINLATASNI